MEELAASVDVIFTATPQGFLAGVLTEEILNKVKIIDLSADFRIKDVATYEKWYKIEHKSPKFIDEAVYGLCGNQQGQDHKGYETCCKSGMLYYMLDPYSIPTCKGRSY